MKNLCPTISELTEITEGIDIESAHGWIFYDSACASCRRAAKTLSRFFDRRGFYFLPLQTPWAQERLGLLPETLLREMRVLTSDGRSFGGTDAVVFLAAQIWWARPLAMAAKLPWIHRCLDRAYRWVAAHRGCTHNSCAAPRSATGTHLGRHGGRFSPCASEAARDRILADRGELLLYAHWDNAVFIHYEADPRLLQQCVPFALDLFEGRAFVSVVAFTLRRMRPRRGGKISELLFKPIANHDFFNVRAYVRDRGERAIFFMSEWLSNRLSVALGPSTFGLPYRYGRIDYQNRGDDDEVRGQVVAKEGRFSYHAPVAEMLRTCEPGSLDEFLLERYTAFTAAGRRKQFFRVWHEPWAQTAIEIDVAQDQLLAATGNWWPSAQLFSANYSPGVNVWMGRPHRVDA